MPSAASPAPRSRSRSSVRRTYKGGVAAHTTTLAHELAEAGHEVTLVSWSHLYPSALYPGEQAVPGGSPDVEPFPRTLRVLSWAAPTRGCAPAAGCVTSTSSSSSTSSRRRARPPRRAARRGRRPHVDDRSRAALGRHRAQRPPARGPPRRPAAHGGPPPRVDAVVVHSDEQASLAASLGATHVKELDLPPHLPGGDPDRAPARPATPTCACSRSASSGTTRVSTSSPTPCATCPAPGSPSPASCGGMPAAASASWPTRARGPRRGARRLRPADRIAGLMARTTSSP